MHLQVWEQIKNHKIRAFKTLIACLGHGCNGLQGGIIGPALLDLSILVQCNFDQISHMVTGRFAGYALGSIIAGVIAPRTNQQMVLCSTLLISALFHFAMPLAGTLSVMLTLITLTGIANGMMDTASNMFIIQLWAKECPPFLQALHFCFGMGSLVAPLIAEPYLKESEEEYDHTSNINSSNTFNSSMHSNNTFTKASVTPGDIELMYPYFIISIFTIFVSICFLFLFIKYRETSDHPSRLNVGRHNSKQENIEMKLRIIKIMDPKVQILVVGLTCCFTFIYVGLETSIGTFIPAYSHKGPLQVSKKTGAMMSSAYWFAFTCFRLISVVLSSILGSTWILILNLGNSIIGSVLMLVSQNNVPLFWFACIYIGIGLSSTWGSLFGFMESQFPMTPPIVTCFTVGACIGCSVIPALVGHYVDKDTSTFVYIALGFSVIVAIVFLFVFIICKKWLFKYEVLEKVKAKTNEK